MNDKQTAQTAPNEETAVLFNADCPVCNFEISHYATYAAQGNLAIRFDDLNACDLSRWGVSADQAARRLHVRKTGKIHVGVDAFIALWQDMPRYRLLAHIVGLPGILQLSRAVYDYALAPVIYRAHLRRQAKP